MTKGLIGVALGLVVYIVVVKFVDALVTGSSTGDVIIQQILGLAVAIGIVIFAFTTFLRGGGK